MFLDYLSHIHMIPGSRELSNASYELFNEHCKFPCWPHFEGPCYNFILSLPYCRGKRQKQAQVVMHWWINCQYWSGQKNPGSCKILKRTIEDPIVTRHEFMLHFHPKIYQLWNLGKKRKLYCALISSWKCYARGTVHTEREMFLQFEFLINCPFS